MQLSEQLSRVDQFSRKHLHLSLVCLLFWVSFSLLLVIHCVENTSLIYQDLPWIKGMYLFRNLLYIVLLVKAGFLTVYRSGQLWIILGILFTALLCAVCSSDFTLFGFAVIAIAARDIPSRQLVKVFAIIKTAALIITLLLYACNILPTIYYENSTDVNNTFGFCHRNVLGANMYTLCLCWFYLRYQKLQKWDYLLWLGLSVITYLLADSRTSLLMMVLAIGLFFGLKLKEQKILTWPYLRKVLIGFIVGLFLLSLICTVFYKRYNDFWEFIDKIFTKRLRFAHQCLNQYGLSMFGQRINFVSTLEAQNNADMTRLILDNAFMRALIYNGIIPCVIFFFLYIRAMHLAATRKHSALIATLVLMAICGISERFMLDVYYNFPLLICCAALLRQSSASEEITHLPFEYAKKVIVQIRDWYITTFPRDPEAE